MVTIHKSACPLDCPDLCGLDVTVENGRVTKVDGDHRSPITNGFICGKVRKIADHLYCDERVLAPRIRVGAKGGGQWRDATWDEALGVITDKLAHIKATRGGEAILPYHYGGSNGWLTEGGLAGRFFRRLGASTLKQTFCAAATMAAVRGMYGVMPGVALEDYAHAQLIVLWGVNPSATSIHLVPMIEKAREAGAKLVVVDPRRTPLARRADLHLAVQPGGDLPVALAIANALFTRGLADQGFLESQAAEVDDFAARAARWSIADAATAAQLPAADIEAFIELYSSISPAVIRVGWGLERNRNGGSAAAAIMALPAVAGKFGVRGGGYTMSNGDVKWTLAQQSGIDEPAANTRAVNMSDLPGALRLTDPRVEALFVYNCNPAVTAPDQRGVLAELAREDLFVVVHEQVMTDTANLADIVLPATTFLEHRELRRGYGTMRLYDSPAVVAPPGDARSNTAVFGELLRRFDLVRPGDAMTDDELVASTLAASEHGAKLRAELDQNGVALPPLGDRPLPFVDAFPGTPDAKVHLVPAALDREAAPTGGLYAYQSDPGTAEYPLALISPALATQISSTFGQLRSAPAHLELHPDDAAARGIGDGDPVRIFNAQGEIRCDVKLSRDVRPGVCSLPKGLWRKHTANQLTSNALIPARFADLGGQAAFNDARVQVERA